MTTFKLADCSETWIEIAASITAAHSGYARVSSSHFAQNGVLRQTFESVRPEDMQSTEYGLGLSVIHDAKDHYLHGLDITPLTEFQTIVQTYYGREISGGRLNTAENGDFVRSISNALSDEFYGPRQPRVYDTSARGLVFEYGSGLSVAEKAKLLLHMHRICFEIILPEVSKLYASEPSLLSLQKSTLEQTELVNLLMPGVVWLNEEMRILKAIDNLDCRLNVRVHPHLAAQAASRNIAKIISEYTESEGITNALGPVFSVKDYCV